MTFRGTDPESYMTEYTSVYENKISVNLQGGPSSLRLCGDGAWLPAGGGGGGRLKKYRMLCIVANRATLPQKWPPPPRNVADSCELTASTKPTGPSISRYDLPRSDASSLGTFAMRV